MRIISEVAGESSLKDPFIPTSSLKEKKTNSVLFLSDYDLKEILCFL